MIQSVEQALFCLLTPVVKGEPEMSYCKNCKYSEMCGRVVAVIAEYKELFGKVPEEGGEKR